MTVAADPAGHAGRERKRRPVLRRGDVVADAYRVVRPLGDGDAGAFWEAQYLGAPDERVALRVLPHLAKNAEAVTRFHRDVEAVGRLESPNIVKILGAGVLPEHGSLTGIPYLVLELLHGESLAAFMGRRRLPLAEVLSIVRQVGAALAVAHAAGIVHRGLTPNCLFLCGPGAGGFGERVVKVLDLVKVQDLGIPQIVGSGCAFMNVRRLLSALRYRAPEQVSGGHASAGPATDVYALGVVAFEMLTGCRPFAGDDPSSLIRAIVGAPLPPLLQSANIPPAVAAAVTRALARNPAGRFGDVAGFVEAIGAPGGAPIQTAMQEALDQKTVLHVSLAESTAPSEACGEIIDLGDTTIEQSFWASAPPESPAEDLEDPPQASAPDDRNRVFARRALALLCMAALVATAVAGSWAFSRDHRAAIVEDARRAADMAGKHAGEALAAQIADLKVEAADAISSPELVAAFTAHVDAHIIRSVLKADSWRAWHHSALSSYGLALDGAELHFVEGIGIVDAALGPLVRRASHEAGPVTDVVVIGSRPHIAAAVATVNPGHGSPRPVLLVVRRLEQSMLRTLLANPQGAVAFCAGRNVLVEAGPAPQRSRLRRAIGSDWRGVAFDRDGGWAASANLIAPGLWLWSLGEGRATVQEIGGGAAMVDVALWLLAAIGTSLALRLGLHGGVLRQNEIDQYGRRTDRLT
jgi:serine/threonine protein kinase